MLRLRTIYSSYISFEFIKYFLISFLFFFVAFFINQILFYMQILLKNYVPFLKAFEFIIYTLPIVVALSAPFSALIGVMLTLYRFFTLNEILAFRTLGISVFDLLKPFLAIGLLISILSFIANDILLPLGAIARLKVFNSIKEEVPNLVLKPFSSLNYGNVTLVLGEKNSDGSFKDVLFFENNNSWLSDKSFNRVFLAKKFYVEKQESNVFFVLKDILSIALTKDIKGYYNYFYADEVKYSLRQIIFTNDFLLSNFSPYQMSIRDTITLVIEKVKEMQINKDKRQLEIEVETLNMDNAYINSFYKNSLSEDERAYLEQYYYYQHNNSLFKTNYNLYEFDEVNLNLIKLELLHKFSTPLSVFYFIVIAFSFSMIIGKGSIVFQLVLGLLLCILYWVLFIGGKLFLIVSDISPLLITLAPNLFLFFLSLVLFLIAIRK